MKASKHEHLSVFVCLFFIWEGSLFFGGYVHLKIFLCVWLFGLQVCLCATYMQCLQRPEDDIGSPELELQMIVSTHVSWE